MRSGPTDSATDVDAPWLVRLDGIAFRYDNNLLAIEDVNLTIHQGEVLALVGPSGCGKSTLLSIIAGLSKPTIGSVTWSEKPNSGSTGKPRQRDLSVVFQKDTVLPWRTVARNIDFGLQYIDIAPEERRERVNSLLRMSKLEDFRDAYPRELSGGMRRRLALLMAIAPMPRLLLMDEPFSGLDEPTRVVVHQDLLDIIYRLGLTVVLVTHDVAEAISLSDRLCVLSARPGRIRWEVDVDLGRPRNLQDLRATPRYGQLYSNVWREVWASAGEKPNE